MLARKFPAEEFQDWKEADSQEVLDSQAAELTEDLEKLTSLSDAEDEDSDGVVQRSELTSSAMKKGLQLADKLVDHLFRVENFMDRCLRYKMKAVMEDTHMYTRTCRRRQSSQGSPLSPLSLAAPPPPYILCPSITLISSSQEHQRCSIKYRHKCLRVF
jgi:hypothetical protein